MTNKEYKRMLERELILRDYKKMADILRKYGCKPELLKRSDGEICALIFTNSDTNDVIFMINCSEFEANFQYDYFYDFSWLQFNGEEFEKITPLCFKAKSFGEIDLEIYLQNFKEYYSDMGDTHEHIFLEALKNGEYSRKIGEWREQNIISKI